MINPKEIKKLEEAFRPSSWIERAINKIHFIEPYPNQKTRHRIFEEERLKK